MKNIFLISVIIALCACKHKTHGPSFEPDVIDHKEDLPSEPARILTYNDTAAFPYSTEDTFGYFSGYVGEKVDSLERSYNNKLCRFVEDNVNKKDIVLLNDHTLSNACFIDPKKKVRIDTMKNNKTTIISIYHFGEKESQDIFIDGKNVIHYKYTGIDSLQQDIVKIYGESFRHFSFKGKAFYYFEGGIMDCNGGSACLLEYQFVYNVGAKQLSQFSTFRVLTPILFGDINGDDDLDFLEINNNGMFAPVDIPNYFTMDIYSFPSKGNAYKLADKKGKAYFIKGNSGEDLYVGDSMNIDHSYWPKKLMDNF